MGARATLLFHDIEGLRAAIDRIKETFPDILKEFVRPNENGIQNFLYQVCKKKKVPDTDIIPYRCKANSSQKGKEEPLLYNFNFFDLVPEFHRIGNTEMFVAFELQIGLKKEVEGLRKDHVAYE